MVDVMSNVKLSKELYGRELRKLVTSYADDEEIYTFYEKWGKLDGLSSSEKKELMSNIKSFMKTYKANHVTRSKGYRYGVKDGYIYDFFEGAYVER